MASQNVQPDRAGDGANLAHMNVIVSGAGRGLGAATAEHLAEAGAAVVCLDLKGASATAKRITAAGGQALAVDGDVRDASDWAGAVARGTEEFGPIGGLANIAGVVLHLRGGEDVIHLLGEEDFDWILDVNLRGAWLGMRAVLPGMLEQGFGSIVNITSVAADVGIKGLAAYSASKGALQSLTRQAAAEYGPQVRVNSLAPGSIDTPMSANATEEVKEALASGSPMKRRGVVEDYVPMIAFMFSEQASFLTGAAVALDGGFSAI